MNIEEGKNMDIYQIIEKVNTKEIMGEEIRFDDKERIVSELLASTHSKDGADNNMSSVRLNANAKYMYPVFFIPPHGEKKHRLVQGFLPKTKILAANYYELESLRIMTKFAPDNLQVKQMIEDTTQRLKNTCFGNFCMQGECLVTGISVLRFLVAARPGDKEWISKLLMPLGELFDSFGSGQAAVQKGIPVSYLLMAFTDINNDETRRLIENKKEWLLKLLRQGWITGKLSNGKISEIDTYNLLYKYIIRNALGTLPEFKNIAEHEIYVKGEDGRCYCKI